MRPSVRPTTAWTTSETTTRATCTSLEHERRARTLVHLLILSHTSLAQDLSRVISSPLSSMSAPPWVASPLLPPPVLPCLLLFLPPPALRAVLWARQPDRHGKPVLLRQGEWRRLRRLRLPHDITRVQQAFTEPTWRSMTLVCDKAIEITNVKSYVFAD